MHLKDAERKKEHTLRVCVYVWVYVVCERVCSWKVWKLEGVLHCIVQLCHMQHTQKCTSSLWVLTLQRHSHTHTNTQSMYPHLHTVCVHAPIPTHSLCTHTHTHTQSVYTHPYSHPVCVHTPILTPSLCTHTHTHTQSVYTHPYPHTVCVHTPMPSHSLCTHTHTHTQSEGSDSAEALCSFMVSCSSSTLWTLPKKSVSSTLSGSRWNRSVRALTVEMHWWRGHTCSCARNTTDTLDKQVILINSNHNKERLISTDASTIIINKSENNNYTELTEQF